MISAELAELAEQRRRDRQQLLDAVIVPEIERVERELSGEPKPAP